MLKKITQEELDKIIEKHQQRMVSGQSTDLSGMDLRGLNLSNRDLNYMNIRNTDLSGANLSGAYCYKTEISYCDFSDANCSQTNFCEARLDEVTFSSSLCCEARFCEAQIHRVSFTRANLMGADFYRAEIHDSTFDKAILFGANFSYASNAPYVPMTCPDEGAFIGWKKCRVNARARLGDEKILLPVIVQLEIPADARRSSAAGRKCRCDKAIVKSITSVDGQHNIEKAYSLRNEDFVYEVGKTITVEDFDENRFRECSTGIHFFMNRQEAVEYGKSLFMINSF